MFSLLEATLAHIEVTISAAHQCTTLRCEDLVAHVAYKLEPQILVKLTLQEQCREIIRDHRFGVKHKLTHQLALWDNLKLTEFMSALGLVRIKHLAVHRNWKFFQ